jgi:hypothetical protein
MHPRPFLFLSLVLLAAGWSGGSAADKRNDPRLRDELVGYSLRYPRGWEVTRRPVGGTEFAAGARCRSVHVVDFAPPPESGGGFILHSFVQVCARPLTGGSSLDDFMRHTYRDSLLAQFEVTKLGGVRAYAARKGDQNLIFLQTGAYRLQLYTSVVAAPAKRAVRRAQVRGVLRSFAFA